MPFVNTLMVLAYLHDIVGGHHDSIGPQIRLQTWTSRVGMFLKQLKFAGEGSTKIFQSY